MGRESLFLGSKKEFGFGEGGGSGALDTRHLQVDFFVRVRRIAATPLLGFSSARLTNEVHCQIERQTGLEPFCSCRIRATALHREAPVVLVARMECTLTVSVGQHGPDLRPLFGSLVSHEDINAAKPSAPHCHTPHSRRAPESTHKAFSHPAPLSATAYPVCAETPLRPGHPRRNDAAGGA